jgi:hypothetical protein
MLLKYEVSLARARPKRRYCRVPLPSMPLSRVAAHFMLDTGLLDQFQHFRSAINKQFLELE